jgi:hypothetical protein
LDTPVSLDTGAAVAFATSATDIRDGLLGKRVTIVQLAVALNKSERTIQAILKAKHVPYLRVGNTRFVDLEDFRRAAVEEGTAR